MEIDVNRLTPGMILRKDVVGKNGKPIIPKNTELTDLHIEFIKKFLIRKVSVSPLTMNAKNSDPKKIENVLDASQNNQALSYVFERAVQSYKEMIQRVENNVAIQMFKIREEWIPIFHEIAEKPMKQMIQLMDSNIKTNENKFYTQNVIKTFLAVALVKRLGYEQKDWLQLGFAALLSDIGIAKLANGINSDQNENWRLHPVYSYKLIEKEVTLNKQAKLAILQHHEYLDGSGFPSGNTREKIHPFSQIIAVCDYFVTQYGKNNLNQIIHLLNTHRNTKFSDNIIDTLLKEL